MPVTTRNQAKSNPLASPPMSLSKVPKRRKQNADEDENDEYLSMNTIAAALPLIDLAAASAHKAPMSFPVPESSDLSENGAEALAEDVVSAIPPPAAPTTEQSVEAESQPAPVVAAPKPYVPPEEKLLKRLPDKPVECTKLPDGPEPVAVEIEYPERSDLQPVENADAALPEMLTALDSTNWIEACQALLTLRQFAVHHSSLCASNLEVAVPLVIKSMRSLRSSLCKTALMTANDLYLSFGDDLLQYSDVGGPTVPVKSLLAQLLLKAASNDKKFVIEAAVQTLHTLTGTLTPTSLYPLLVPYIDHKNPKVRGKTALSAAATIARMTPMQAAETGLPALMNVCGKLITDNTPDARDSAKQIGTFVKGVLFNAEIQGTKYAELIPPEPTNLEEDQVMPTPWQRFVQSCLNPSSALAVLRAIE